MQLKLLLSSLKFKNKISIPEITIKGIAYDSRRVERDFLFVAIEGFSTDGHRFISQAIERGACAVLAQREVQLPIPLFIVPHTRKALAQLSNTFFEEPTRSLTLIGITGTNGKTTLTYLLEAIFKAHRKNPAVLGTINYRLGTHVYPASHTTPESYDLQQLISQMKAEGADTVVMEVSSHALDLHRVDGLHFDVGVFTNLTPEHLDYHKTLEKYFKTKAHFFRELLPQSKKKNKRAVLNLDDPFVKSLGREIVSQARISYSLSAQADVYPLSYELALSGIRALVSTPWGKIQMESPLLGAYNLSNLLAAVAVAGSLGIPLSTIQKAMEDFKAVPGRLERVPNQKGIHVFVDYAHTPDALKNVLEALRNVGGAKHLKGGRLLIVFGCGGDRDQTKRPLMGQEVARRADGAVVTSDNPRTEDPQKIISMIVPGLISEGWKQNKDFIVEPDRAKAITLALSQAQAGDIVVIAGKGHEDYQILGTQKIHFDDREVAGEFLK